MKKKKKIEGGDLSWHLSPGHETLYLLTQIYMLFFGMKYIFVFDLSHLTDSHFF